jgi:hypothetical protein
MGPQTIEHLQTIYDEAITKLQSLKTERSEIIAGYIKDLEQKKIQMLRDNLINPTTN